MDLEAARKALSKRSTFSSKRVAFFGVVGLCLVAGVLLRLGLVPQPEVEQNAPVAVTPSPPPAATPTVEATKSVPPPEVEQNAPVAVTPSPPPAATPTVEATKSVPPPEVEQNGPGAATATPSAPPATAGPAVEGTGAVPQSSLPAPTGEAVGEPEPAGEADEHAEPGLPGSGIILVARQPVEVLASPSSSASALYGFPAGRPFRVIGRQGGFAHVQDLKSSASGWIDEAALAQPPPAPAASALTQPKTSANPEIATQPDRRRPGLFGRGGLFGGIFGNGN